MAWNHCRSFHAQKMGLTGDFVSASRFVSIPLEEEAAVQQARLSGLPVEECFTLEYFVTGSSSGEVALLPIMSEQVEGAFQGAKSGSSAAVVPLYSHKEQVLGLSVVGTLLATCSSDGSCVVSLFHPAPARVVATLPHPASVYCMELWEGPEEWRLIPGEEAAAYVFTGCNDGLVRMWRVDVMAGTFVLHNVFAAQVAGLEGVAAEATSEEVQGSGARRIIQTPVRCLAIDGTRLLAGMDGVFACYSIDASPDNASGLRHRTTPEESYDKIHDREWFNAAVWMTEEHSAVKAVQTARQFFEDKSSSDDASLSAIKAKHTSLVCGGLSIGHSVNNIEFVDEGPNAVATVLFPALKNTQRIPLRALHRVRTSALVGNAHTGPMFSIALMREGRFVSGGADGAVSVWEYDDAEEKYAKLHTVAGHTDLVRRVLRVRSPDVFLSCSEDGWCREWHIIDEPQALICQGALFVGVHDNLKKVVSTQAIGISCAEYYPPAQALFLVGAFESIIRTYALLPVATCELPPGWIFDGSRSVKVEDVEETARRRAAKEANDAARRANFDAFEAALREEKARRGGDLNVPAAVPSQMELLSSSSSSATTSDDDDV